ncbi:MAG: S46 family peptidase [Candidatus Eremiobacteraeota bacterium]|nr:S46 family peptidase [Candidatus Eremiobacteraeota bacterium]
MQRLAVVLAALAVVAPQAARADEGMWTIDRFPVAAVQKAYGFTATPAFLNHIRASSVRLPGCSGSFVSRDGLIMTNHHCARGCIQALSDPQHDYIASGFFAKSAAEERVCPGFQINSLLSIAHVTPQVVAATKGTTGADFNAKQRAVFARLESACQSGDATLQCQVVSLYHGGIYDLYKYRRYTDVRLVFAPEEAIAFFGGDPDNFTYPRYDLDCAFLRAYDAGKPVTAPDFFPWSPGGTRAGQLVFVPGNPGSTSRLQTLSQLEMLRDYQMPRIIRSLAENRGMLTQFSTESAEHARIARNALFGTENSLKGDWGREEELLDPTFMERKAAAERVERAAIARNPQWRAEYGGAWDAIARAQRRAVELGESYAYRELQGAPGAYLGFARTLVRAAAELPKPNAQRLREFQDAAIPQLRQRLNAPVPIYPDLERVTLANALTKMREWLGEDDPFVRAMLANDSPQTVADRIVAGSHLSDPAVRRDLFGGGATAVAASTDPAIVLMRAVDPLARATRKQYEDEVLAPARLNGEKVAQADFALHGASTYPDATFTLRVSYGAVSGYQENGHAVAPYTTIAGAYRHATGSPPFDLPASWMAAQSTVKGDTPLDFVASVDIIGGNSGSPVIDAQGRIVGLIFDGNIESLGGDYVYDPRQNRAVAVDSRGLLEALRDVYHADRLVTELTTGAAST